MSILNLVIAIVLGMVIVEIALVLIISVLFGIFAIPCYIFEKFHDRKMEKELLEKGAKPNTFKVEHGRIFQK